MRVKNMSKSAKNIVTTVREALEGTINELGYRLWDLEYVKEASEWYLRFTIDNDEGITIDDCEKVHRAIDPMLDDLDPIEDSYHLEVSSPGIERTIRTDEHLQFCLGEQVEAKLFSPFDGSKVYNGSLDSFTADVVVIGGKEIPRDKISKMNTVYDF